VPSVPPKTPQAARIVAVAKGHVSVRTESGQYVDVLLQYIDAGVGTKVGAGGVLAYGPVVGGFGYWLVTAE